MKSCRPESKQLFILSKKSQRDSNLENMVLPMSYIPVANAFLSVGSLGKSFLSFCNPVVVDETPTFILSE